MQASWPTGGRAGERRPAHAREYARGCAAAITDHPAQLAHGGHRGPEASAAEACAQAGLNGRAHADAHRVEHSLAYRLELVDTPDVLDQRRIGGS